MSSTGWSADSEAAWLAFARRGPWINKEFHWTDYPALRDFSITVHQREEADRVNARAVTRRLIEDELAPDPDTAKPGVAADRADHIGDLHGQFLELLKAYDGVRQAGTEDPCG